MIELVGDVQTIDDPDTEAWVGWLIEVLGHDAWNERRRTIDDFLASRGPLMPNDISTTSFIPPDPAAWHVFLCECWLRNHDRYDIAQGARHIPVARAIGRQLAQLREAPGFEARVAHALRNEPARFDSTLFEVLVAAAYLRAGWSAVRFVDESRSERRPDLQADGEPGTIFIECKRKARVSDYAVEERRKWLQIFEPIGELLRSRGLALVLDIEFRIPVVGLDDAYLLRRIGGLLPLCVPGVLVDDDELFIRVREVDLGGTRRELRNVGVRVDGSRLHHLLFGFSNAGFGATGIWLGELRPGRPKVVDDISFACGAIWKCVADDATAIKARHMKRELAEAVRQIPAGAPAAFHWGIDLYDGEQVGAAIYERTVGSVEAFDPGPTDLRWIYAHVLEFTVPVDGNWAVEETCHRFVRDRSDDRHLLEEFLFPDEDRTSVPHSEPS